MQNANLLLYINLSGEVFYIIAHRMRSQKVTEELQQRVYNDLAVAICHPTVINNLTKGALQLLELNLVDVRTLMDRIVHSSIMTVNAFSMEKLFELTLIATRYQYTVCHHPKDILLIALNHLDSIRKSINDAVGIQLTKNLHATLVDRMKGLNSVKMQDYRYAILTYLADVKLKMTNLIRLGLQKPSGEFVKEFPDKVIRPEFSKPGKIEMDEAPLTISSNNKSDGESDSDSEDREEGDNVEEAEDDNEEKTEATMDSNELLEEDQGCHTESVLKGTSEGENDEVLEILSENEFSEFHEADQLQNPTFVIRFQDEKPKEGSKSQDQPLKPSLELNGNRGITLGLSIYEIPGNSDEDMGNLIPPKQRSQSIPSVTSEKKPSIPVVDPKAVQGLDLCSILLGCKQEMNSTKETQRLYHSPAQLENYRRRSSMENLEDIPIASGNGKHEVRRLSQVSGINVVKFDARTDRSGSKAALTKISREFDMDATENTGSLNPAENTTNSNSLFDLILDDD